MGLLPKKSSVMFLPQTSAVPQVKAGRLHALAVALMERVPALPDLPSVSESAPKGYRFSQRYGMLVLAGTPAEVLARVNAKFWQMKLDW